VASEVEEKVHLRGPPADAAHPREGLDDLVVAEAPELFEAEAPGDDLGGELPDVADLLRREPCGPQRGLRGHREPCRTRQLGSAARGHEATVDRRAGGAADLLEDDGADEGRETLGRTPGPLETHPRDQLFEPRVGPSEMFGDASDRGRHHARLRHTPRT
jgi:hypothetical protein